MIKENQKGPFSFGLTLPARLLLMVLLFPLLSPAYARSEPPGQAQAGEPERIRTEYDESKDLTTITLNPLVLVSRRHEELRLGAVASYKGKGKGPPRAVTLIIISLSKFDSDRYATARKLTFTADGERLSLGQTQRTKQSQGGVFIESMAAEVPFDGFMKIARAKEVSLKLGLTEVRLPPEQITVMRAYAGYLTP